MAAKLGCHVTANTQGLSNGIAQGVWSENATLIGELKAGDYIVEYDYFRTRSDIAGACYSYEIGTKDESGNRIVLQEGSYDPVPTGYANVDSDTKELVTLPNDGTYYKYARIRNDGGENLDAAVRIDTLQAIGFANPATGAQGPTGPQGATGASGVNAFPIGVAVPWFKNLYNTLPNERVECNGQTIDDGESPLDGLTIPNLNGDGLFVRGSATAGTAQDDATAVNGLQLDPAPDHAHYIAVFDVSGAPNSGGAYQGKWGNRVVSSTGAGGGHGHGLAGDDETRPKNISAVWVMRIK